jgi:hypothetical protein
VLRTQINAAAVASLVVGLLVGSTLATGVAMAVDHDAAPARKGAAVKVCITKDKVVRSATATGGCPAGTSKKRISVKGPRGASGPAGPTGPAGPGATSSVEVVAPDEVVRPLGAGLTFRCRTAAAHIIVSANPGSDLRGLLGREAGGNNVATALQIGFAQAGGENFVNGEVFGTDPATGTLEHVSFAISWLTSSSQCEVRRLRIPVA